MSDSSSSSSQSRESSVLSEWGPQQNIPSVKKPPKPLPETGENSLVTPPVTLKTPNPVLAKKKTATKTPPEPEKPKTTRDLFLLKWQEEQDKIDNENLKEKTEMDTKIQQINADLIEKFKQVREEQQIEQVVKKTKYGERIKPHGGG